MKALELYSVLAGLIDNQGRATSALCWCHRGGMQLVSDMLYSVLDPEEHRCLRWGGGEAFKDFRLVVGHVANRYISLDFHLEDDDIRVYYCDYEEGSASELFSELSDVTDLQRALLEKETLLNNTYNNG
jgi:hypothetical protein